MSLNCVMLSADRKAIIPLPEEKIFYTQDTVKLTLDCSENDYPGNSFGHWSSQGVVYLSNQRIVFIAKPSTEQLQSLNIPILHFKNWKLEQPWFGANYIEATVVPVQGGGLPKSGKLTLTFREGGAIEFTTILHSLLERIAETNEVPAHLESLPTYQAEAAPPSSSSSLLVQPLPMPVPLTMPFPQTMPVPHTQTVPTPQIMPMPTSQTTAGSADDLPPSYDDIHRYN